MAKISTDTWRYTVSYSSSVRGFHCHGDDCPPETRPGYKGRRFQCRIYAGDKTSNMDGPNFAVKLPVSQTSAVFEEKPTFTFYPTFSGHMHVLNFPASDLGGSGNETIRVPILYPPSYNQNLYKKYGVTVLLDFAPETMLINQQLLEEAYKRYGLAEDTIYVGYGDYESGIIGEISRHNLLTPSEGIEFECINGTRLDLCGGCLPANVTTDDFDRIMRDKCGYPVTVGGKLDIFLDFLVKKALPAVVAHSGNRAMISRENLSIVGYSLGGLAACHAAWTRPQIFSAAACQSSSFWWPKRADASCQFEFLNKTLKENRNDRPYQRIHIDVGELEAGGPYDMITAAVRAGASMADLGIFNIDDNLIVKVFTGQRHSGLEWYNRLWNSLSHILRPQGDPYEYAS